MARWRGDGHDRPWAHPSAAAGAVGASIAAAGFHRTDSAALWVAWPTTIPNACVVSHRPQEQVNFRGALEHHGTVLYVR
eukprot:COSAG01_NODE_1885_length_8988_cov_2.861514_4_plen_79_part_00